jgi:hypothetical protein
VKHLKRNIFFTLLGGAVLWAILWYQRQFRTYESSALADVTWTVGGEACVAEVRVRDVAGRPVPKVLFGVMNESGGNDAVSDASGLAVIRLGEGDFEGLFMDGKYIVSRPWGYWLKEPNVGRGLKFEVVKK